MLARFFVVFSYYVWALAPVAGAPFKAGQA